MNQSYDAIVIGGGIIGTATGYYLSERGLKVLLLEKDFMTAGSTGRCITGIRQQFSTPATIQIAMESVRLFKSMQDELGMDVEWTASGYLLLAHEPRMKAVFEKSIAIQRQFGVDVSFVSSEACSRIVPLLNTNGLLGGAWCPADGQANPFLVVQAYENGIRRNGGTIKINAPVVKIGIRDRRAQSVTTAGGETFHAGMILNAAGPWAREVGRMAGVELEVEPERHEALITEGVEYTGIPMLVDYRAEGGYFVQRVTGQFIGCFTPEKRVPGHDKESTLDFLIEMSRRMCRLVPALKNVAILRQWAGSYSMTPDGTPIVDESDVKGFFCSVGMCGHGFMLGPALGKYMAGFMAEGSWPMAMDEMAFGRTFGEREDLA